MLDRIPTGRLVVLGEPGSGKTMLLIRLVLDLLDQRKDTPDCPVPLLIPLASFNPDRDDLYSWLETQIIREHQWLATTTAAGDSRARALLKAGRVLPVLDGLDEIRSGGRDRVIAAINDTLRDGERLVLSCRVKAYRHAIRPGPGRLVHLEAAAAIRLCPLDPHLVGGYLTDTAGSAGTARWVPVLAALAAVPEPPVARALSTPLMASLARAVYNPRQAESPAGLPDPAELCDTIRLPTKATVEKHLFNGLIPAAYRPVPDHRNRWTAEQAKPHLIFLAHHLEYRLRTTSLAWWELVYVTPQKFPVLVGGLVFGLVVGLVGGLGVDTLTDTRQAADPRGVLVQDRASALVVGLGVGLVCSGSGTGSTRRGGAWASRVYG